MPNLDKGKTEALVSCVGQGARKVRIDHLSDDGPTVSVLSEQWKGARLRIVPMYKHLGGVLHHKGGLRAEVRVRTALAWQSFRKHWSRLFGQAHVCLADKVQLFQTLVLPCLFYGAGTWTDITDGDLRPLSRCYHDMCRSLLRRHFRGDTLRLHEDRVRALIRVPAVASWIHFTRLSYLASFVRVGVREAWALAHAECRWLASVRDSLSWLRGMHHPRSDSDSWQTSWGEWCELIVSHPAAWKRMLRQALQRDMRLHVLDEGWQHCRGLFAKCLMNAGAFLQQRCDDSQSAGHFCGVCRRRFSTKQQWAVHAFKRHGIVKASRLVSTGTQCPQCLKQFPSNIALCNHFDYSYRCMEKLLRRGFVCDPEPGFGSRRADHGRDFLGYAKQGFGPRWDESGADDTGLCVLRPTAASAVVLAELRSVLRTCVGSSIVVLLEAYRQAYCAVCISREQLMATAGIWCDMLADWAEDLSIRDAAMHRAAAEWVRDNWSVDWLCGYDAVDAGLVQPVYRASAAVLASLDFGIDLQRAALPFVPAGGFVMCPERYCAALVQPGHAWRHHFGLDDCARSSSWLDVAYATAAAEDAGHFLFCLDGLTTTWGLEAVTSQKGFYSAVASMTLYQDVVLVLAQLCAAEATFAAVLPKWDEALVSILKRLPGVQWTDGGRLVLLHSALESSLPEFLFHILN